MSRPEQRVDAEAAAELARRTRAEQGFPPVVEDSVALRKIAVLIASRRERAS